MSLQTWPTHSLLFFVLVACLAVLLVNMWRRPKASVAGTVIFSVLLLGRLLDHLPADWENATTLVITLLAGLALGQFIAITALSQRTEKEKPQ
jgi:peptidoglycan/LPS O-acetylase OafA/YrhL